MFVTTGCGGCAIEHNQLVVTMDQLATKGMRSQLRSSLVRMMALFGANTCFTLPSSETVEARQEFCLNFQEALAECMVGTLPTAGSWLSNVSLYANAYPVLLSFTATLAFVPVLPQAHGCKLGIKCSSASCRASVVEHTAILRGQSPSTV